MTFALYVQSCIILNSYPAVLPRQRKRCQGGSPGHSLVQYIDMIIFENIDIDMAILENIDIDQAILKNIDRKSLRNIDIDIDKGIIKISI